jgi:hypothetical protein
MWVGGVLAGAAIRLISTTIPVVVDIQKRRHLKLASRLRLIPNLIDIPPGFSGGRSVLPSLKLLTTAVNQAALVPSSHSR